MRRILRLTDTGRFIKAPGEDTTYFHEGQPFSGFADAWTFCNERGLEGTELVLTTRTAKNSSASASTDVR